MEQIINRLVTLVISIAHVPLSATFIIHESYDKNEVLNALTSIENGLGSFLYTWFDCQWWKYWLLIGVLLGIAMFIWGCIRIIQHKSWIKQITLLVLISGFLLYFIGFYEEGSSRSLWAMFLRPLMSSMAMFLAHSDLIEVCNHCKNCQTYMTLFSITHFCAIFISFYVVLNWAWQRLRKWGCLYFKEKCFDFKKRKYDLDLYIFFDTNDAAWTLAKSIEMHYEKKRNQNEEEREKQDFRIIFVDEPEEVEDDKEKKTFIDLLNIKAFRKSTQERINSKEVKNALFVRSDKNISSNFTEENTGILWKLLGIENVLTFIQKGNNVRLFFFSEDTEDNLKAVRNIIEWGRKTKLDKTIDVYCKARNNEKNCIYEESGYLKVDEKKDGKKIDNVKTSIHVHIVDDSSLAILSLKKEAKFHPIQYVEFDVEGTAIVESAFEAVILGFGQTGRDAFRFLYEYATFPGKQNKPYGDERSPIKIHVYDKNMDILKGGFLAKCPALMEDQNQTRYDFHSLDVHRLSFWEEMKSLVNRVNYVIIALGDDDINIATAVDFYKFALRYRKDISKKFDIFVRLYTPEKEMEFDMIKKHLCQDILGKDIYEKNIINRQNLIPFGEKKNIYSYDIIIQEEVLKKAQVFAYIYNGGYQKEKLFDQNCQDAKDDWEKKLKEREYLTEVWNQMRQNEQDISNSLHILTKIQMVQKTHLFEQELARMSFRWPEIAKINKKMASKEKKDEKEEAELNEKYLYLSNIVRLKFYNKISQEHEESKQFGDTMPRSKYDKECQETLLTLSTLIQHIEELSFPNQYLNKEKEIATISPEQIHELENIALCEHLRWNALSELQGYTSLKITTADKNEKCFVSKQLSCLCPWETLKNHEAQDRTRVYDYNIVFGSVLLYLIQEEEKKKEK